MRTVVRMAGTRRSSGPQADVTSVTSAIEPRSVDIVRRQRKYVAAMLLRVVCFVGMLVLPLPLWGRLAFAAVAIFIPYVAVVAANVWAPSRTPFTRASPEVPALTR